MGPRGDGPTDARRDRPRRAGDARVGTVGYVEADGIRYLAGDDFGNDVDRRDDDPREWAFRMDVAALHVRAIVEFDPS